MVDPAPKLVAPKLAALIMAAGSSSRLGQDKSQVRLEGVTLLERTINNARQVSSRVIVVVHSSSQKVESQTDVTWVTNPDPQRGLASSIAIGIRQMASVEPGFDGALVLLADQYRVDENGMMKIIKSWRQHADSIIISSYDGVDGPPVIFPVRCFAMLKESASPSSGRGAKHLLKSEQLRSVSLPEARFDLDTPADLAALREYERNTSEESEKSR